MTVGYDGTAYVGWQIQPNGITVQEVLEQRLAGIVRHEVTLHGSGRTDQGVHARGQVAHVDVRTRMGAVELRRAMNSRLPADVRIMGMKPVNSEFHARRSAVSKEYRYFIWNDEVVPPHERLYTAHVRKALDVEAMQRAADLLVGELDFAAFTANANRVVESTVRTVFSMKVTQRGRKVTISAVGSGFLYKMVRSLAGWLIRVGQGAVAVEETLDVLSSTERTARVPTAHGHGLFLWKVTY